MQVKQRMLKGEGRFKLILVLLLVALVPIATASEEEGCIFKLDNEEYLLDDVAFATITCDRFIGELYVIAWTNPITGIVKEDTGVIAKNVTYQSYLQINDMYGGEVIAYIPNQAEYKRVYKIIDEEQYFYFSLGASDDGTRTEKKFKMLNRILEMKEKQRLIFKSLVKLQKKI